MNKITSLVITIIVLSIIFVRPIISWTTAEVVEIKISDKERIVKNKGEVSKYLVFTEDEVFENTDSWAYLKFNSSDIQGKLSKDSTYKVKVCGFRVPFLSTYRNIIEIK